MKYVPLSLLLLSVMLSVPACGDDDDDGSNAGGTGGGAALGGHSNLGGGNSRGGVANTGGAGDLGGSSGSGALGGSSGSGALGGSSGEANTGGAAGAGASSGGADSGGAGGAAGAGGAGGAPNQAFSFFVTSDVSTTGDLGGLKAADQRCQTLAEAAGVTNRTFRAYLSADADPDNGDLPVNARDRIGSGPWFNSKGVLVAADLDSLHALIGDADLFLDEHGQKIPGQWAGSPQPVEHDILTGSNADGTLAAGKTCASWTSADASLVAVVGHSDGLGPNMMTTGTYTSWNSSHDNMDCSNTAPRGGAGRIYCFAAD